MKTSFNSYEDAYMAGRELAELCGKDVSLRKCNEFGKIVYNLNILPSDEFRFGRDLEGEIIHH